MSIIAELRNVTKTFGSITALDNISLGVNSGEILGLLGPNGSGKTTLLRILAFIQRPTEGEVHLQNTRTTNSNIEQMRMKSTMVFQKTVLFNTTVYNNVAYGLKIRKTPKGKIDKDVRKALELVRLEGFEKRQARKLSGGEQQRVALARALALKTPLLLLDEPTANLDPKSASTVEEAIATANRELETTIVMATHNMLQAKRLPSRIALVENGRVTEAGTPSEVFNRLSKTLACFAALENVFAGSAATTEGGTTLVDIGNGVQLETTGQHSGRISVFISPEDIILSRSRLTSSARNTFKGEIAEILDSDSLVRLKVDVGKPITVQITKRSFNEMGLNLNAEVFLAFKASSVQIV
jgi:tungstate transport system ATP-binding protein